MTHGSFARKAIPLLIGIGLLASACTGTSDFRARDSVSRAYYGDSADWGDWTGWGGWGGFYGYHHGLDYDGFDRGR